VTLKSLNNLLLLSLLVFHNSPSDEYARNLKKLQGPGESG
jgi:hypothetical protein